MFHHRRLAAIVAALVATWSVQSVAQPATSPTPEGVPLRPGQAEALWRMLASAELVGLASRDYLTPTLEGRLVSPDATQRQSGETMLVAAAARYANDVRTGRTAPASFRGDWAIRPAPYDARADLANALAADRLDSWFTTLMPPHREYQSLLTQLARYRLISARGGWKQLDIGRTLKPGLEDDSVAALRERLAAEGFELAPSSRPRLFDAELKQALSRFQATHGLAGGGAADRVTLQALNVPASSRVAAIRANLERWRWLPQMLPQTRVEVNIAAAELKVFDGGTPALTMRTVVGRPADPTPILADEIESVVFNPPWNVPQGIAEREILPKAKREAGYLAREGFTWVQEGGARRLQQRPGPTSALGRYKFDLPNRFNVYLHDTPVRSVFARDRRSLSHGCIRLEQPRALAVWLLGRQTGWDPAAIDRAVAAGRTSSVRLSRSVPVYMLYWTAFVSETGELNFRDDIYGWDRLVSAD